MRAPIFLTVASLLLIGSFSLPQPEDLGPTRTIEGREAHEKPGDWRYANFVKYKHDGDNSASGANTTKIKEREADHETPGNWRNGNFFKYKAETDHSDLSTNSTKIKERQARPSGQHWGPPAGMSWMEFRKYHWNHKGAPAAATATSTSTVDDSTTTDDSTSTGSTTTTDTNSTTKVKMTKFRG